ncbi:hypothetical protein CAPTEDRAFT_216774 [Capitella teleta]|uniref:Dehydrogenase/reductase SDR family member 4 n=1 Tax=Capitella teleta TaxID=283909 RepID=R7V6I0_CAPTE|nr:hypothetical protein CAPTEDRAFT_216774 [Capitella teleta]|eukprot:ELU11966.1 hypothetical protein CAPTEDRAFT_216774 [Capitella teleta]
MCASSIGLATVRRLVREGAKVVLSSRKEANVNKAVSQLKSEGHHDVHGMVCHVGDPEHVWRLIHETNERFGGIDILLPFTGVNMMYGPALNVTNSQFDKIMDVNVKAPFKIIQAAYPFLKERSSIVLMGTYGSLDPKVLQVVDSGVDLYCVSKGTLLVMVFVAILKNIKQMFLQAEQQILDNGHTGFDIRRNTPLKRKGTPEEVASMIAYLVSDEASFITGENFVVAGGLPSRI